MDIEYALNDADLVIFCTPLAQMRYLAEQAVPHLKPGAIVTDVGSVKGPVVEEIAPIIESTQACFIGSHPMAGSEQSGPGAAKDTLYENAVCIVTPTSQTPEDKLEQLVAFWEALGSNTLRLTPDVHDNLTSRCSHLPHIVAAGLANYILSPAHPEEQSELCATGFRDTTRVASGSPEMWRDIVMMNRKHLLRVIGVFVEDMQEFSLALERSDANAVTEFFETAKKRRDEWQDEFNARKKS